MRKGLLICALTASLVVAPSEARADVIGEIVGGLILVAVVGTVIIGTTTVLTTAATYKNYRSSSRHEEASAGWVGVGFVGGLAIAGVGALQLPEALPRTETAPCSGAKDSPNPERYSPTENPEDCRYRVPASTGNIVFSAILMGAGAFAMGYAVKAATTDERSGATTASPGPAPAFIGLSLPVMRF